jgi:RNA-directed DNA polymerase
MLGIPTVVDRLIHQAIRQVLEPVFEPTFSETSYGFRPGRSSHQAIERARLYVKDGNRWVVDLDLEKFFDRVQHDVLMSLVARRIEDKGILKLIRRCLQAGILEGGLVSARTEGTPQGSPLSPLLSNVMLDELDKELERRGHKYVRYADDGNVYVKTQRAGERVMASIEHFLRKRLKLVVNREKSAVDHPWNRKFLSYTMTSDQNPKLLISPNAKQRLMSKLKEIFRRGRGRRLKDTIQELSRRLPGWIRYFRYANGRNGLDLLDRWIRRRLRWILWRQWKKPKTRLKELIKRGLRPELARKGAYNGRGPWWNAGQMHMSFAIPNRELRNMGLPSLLEEYQRLASSS